MDIIFDFGVVVFTWEPGRLIRESLPELELSEDQALQAAKIIFQGHEPNADWSAFDRGTLQAQDVVSKISTRAGWSPSHVERILSAVPGHLLPKPESVSVIETLAQQGHRLFYLSNMPAPYADHIDRTYSFIQRFVAGIYSSRVGLIKPEAEIFFALDSLRASHEQPIFIDDASANVEAAARHGWMTIHFQSPKQMEQALFHIGALPISPQEEVK